MIKKRYELLYRNFGIITQVFQLIVFGGCFNSISAQTYIGVGLHLTPPVEFSSKGHPYLMLQPRAGIGYSFTLKKEWAHRKRNQWYAETGLTTQGLRYYQNNLIGDSVTIWSDFNINFIAYPAVLLGGGYQFGIGKKEDAIALGLEGSFQVTQVVGGAVNSAFSIEHHPLNDAVFPLFLRLNLAYKHPFYWGNYFGGHFQFYTLLSAQKVTQGSTAMANLITGGFEAGRYTINNSELGVKMFIGLKAPDKKRGLAVAAKRAERLVVAKEDPTRMRLSAYGQFFRLPETVFHVPQVTDSFTLTSAGRNMTAQGGVQIEIPFRKDPRWAFIMGLGLGQRGSSMRFLSDGRFPLDGQPVGREYNIHGYGLYGSLNAGISRRRRLFRIPCAHTFSLSFTAPLQREFRIIQVPLTSNGTDFPVVNPILDGRIDAGLGRASLMMGFEYNPEIILPVDKDFFVALGVVFNWTRGVMAQGAYTVSNQHTTYYGAMLQEFGKIGVTARFGLNR